MKKAVKHGFSGWKVLPTEDEVEVAQILLDLPKLFKKEELINRYSFKWGRTKKRSVPESSPEKKTAAEADANPSPSSAIIGFKRKAKDDLMEVYDRMHQAMETKHKQLSFDKMELKAKEVQKTSYPRNMEDFLMWSSPMKTADHEEHCHQQVTMFAPPTPQHHCLPQLVDHDNDKLVGVSSFGLSNHGEPHVKIHGGFYDFMGLSKPLDQSECLVMDDDLRVRMAAEARKRRKLKMNENKSSMLAMKLSRNCR